MEKTTLLNNNSNNNHNKLLTWYLVLGNKEMGRATEIYSGWNMQQNEMTKTLHNVSYF